MIKLNLSFYYQVGAQLSSLVNMPPSSTRIQVAMAASTVDSYVRTLFQNSNIPLKVSYAQANQLVTAIEVMHTKMRTYFADGASDEWQAALSFQDIEFNNVLTLARNLEIVLQAELDALATYYVERKGIYDTDWLIQETEYALPESMRRYLDQRVIDDMRASGRCLALDAPTASGFHILRATESVLHRYYVAVCKPTNKKRLDNWGAYLNELYKVSGGKDKVTLPEVREVYHNLNRIKDRRNNIMHPEMVLTLDQAFTLFENAKSAIMLMLPHVDNEEDQVTAGNEVVEQAAKEQA